MGEIKQLTGEEFRKMQLLELDMLKEFDRVCRENDIKYTIFGGTMLGAVRHKGYIPWDDDADIAMLREEYEKFRAVAFQMNPQICYFQDNENDKEYRWGYGKLRRTGTKFVRVGQEHLKCKTGVFVDVFPMDDIPKCLAGQMINNFVCFCLRKTLWSEVGKYDKSNSIFVQKLYGLLSEIPTEKIFAAVKKISRRSNNNSENLVRTLLFPPTGTLYKKNPIKKRYGMPKSVFLDLAEYDFEGIKLFGTKDYDDILKYIYGDYMELPPEDKRDPHSPVSYYEF